ncbi:hypothetical protein GCM10023259_038610 [Thermocatellispora tengchongensis]
MKPGRNLELHRVCAGGARGVPVMTIALPGHGWSAEEELAGIVRQGRWRGAWSSTFYVSDAVGRSLPWRPWSRCPFVAAPLSVLWGTEGEVEEVLGVRQGDGGRRREGVDGGGCGVGLLFDQ